PVDIVDADDLHRQFVLLDEPPGDDFRVGTALPVLLVPTDVLRSGDAGADGQVRDVLADVLRSPDALGDLGAVIGGYGHLVADPRLVRAGVEVVEPAVPRKRYGHDHAHALTLWLFPRTLRISSGYPVIARVETTVLSSD